MSHKTIFLLSICCFCLIAALCYAANFIPWDETPLEQSLWALPLGIGLLLELPWLFIISLLHADQSWTDYQWRMAILPLVTATTYSLIIYCSLRALLNKKNHLTSILHHR